MATKEVYHELGDQLALVMMMDRREEKGMIAMGKRKAPDSCDTGSGRITPYWEGTTSRAVT